MVTLRNITGVHNVCLEDEKIGASREIYECDSDEITHVLDSLDRIKLWQKVEDELIADIGDESHCQQHRNSREKLFAIKLGEFAVENHFRILIIFY